jgi:hypothetical protein
VNKKQDCSVCFLLRVCILSERCDSFELLSIFISIYVKKKEKKKEEEQEERELLM